MVSLKKEAIAPSFVSSPPLSATPSGGASDYDLDDTTQPRLEKPHGPKPLRKRRPRTDSSPVSASSSIPTGTLPGARSTISSSTTDVDREDPARLLPDLVLHRNADQQEEVPTHASDDLEKAFSLIEASQKGVLPDNLESPEWVVLQISQSRYLYLRRRLENHGLLEYFDHGGLRYDWNPDRGVLVLRLMASHLHECIKLSISDEIKTWLRGLAAGDSQVAELASDITPCGHAWVQLQGNEGTGKKSPDGQFLFIQSTAAEEHTAPSQQTTVPQFITEVGYSQKAKDLKQCAKDYYECSDGKIKTVLTIDLPYADAEDRTAAFCLYRGPKRIFKDTAFRNAQGGVTDASLQLFLSDFIPGKVLRRLDPQIRAQVKQSNIELPARQLCESLEKAEHIQAQVDAEQKRQEARPSKKRKAVHWGSSAEEDEDESKTHSSDSSSSTSSGQDASYQDGRTSSPSKRRRTVPDTAARALPARRRTRSISRAETESSTRRTRSRSRGAAECT